jgi:hypothetical protein
MYSPQSHQMTVQPDEVNAAISKGLSQGWSLVNSMPQEDGTVLLMFQRTAVQPYASGVAGPIDPNIAWLELIGFLGFLGIGYLVAGRVSDGIIRMVAYWVIMFVGWTIVALLTIVIIGFCLIPVMLVVQFGIPIWSALELRKSLEAQPR